METRRISTWEDCRIRGLEILYYDVPQRRGTASSYAESDTPELQVRSRIIDNSLRRGPRGLHPNAQMASSDDHRRRRGVALVRPSVENPSCVMSLFASTLAERPRHATPRRRNSPSKINAAGTWRLIERGTPRKDAQHAGYTVSAESNKHRGRMYRGEADEGRGGSSFVSREIELPSSPVYIQSRCARNRHGRAGDLSSPFLLFTTISIALALSLSLSCPPPLSPLLLMFSLSLSPQQDYGN